MKAIEILEKHICRFNDENCKCDCFIAGVISIYKEELKEIEGMEKESKSRFEYEELFGYSVAISDLRTKLESKIKEWELMGNK